MKRKFPLNVFLTIIALFSIVAFTFKNTNAQEIVTTEETLSNDYQKHVESLKKKLPSKDFNIVIQKPFVVIGDESAEMVKRRSENTVKWAVEKLKASYFTKDPKEILNIWIFKDTVSYRKYTKQLFDDDPDTSYGYYSSFHRALVMNISTGGGTLVHEIVHPFMEANFVDCPSWFNEGLASLYEQSSEKNGQIVGLVNWRLTGLQKAIKNKTNPSFKTLLSTSRKEFYADETGVYYAQARYLCYYLQQKGLLIKFYKEFDKNVVTDPTGYKTLQNVLGVSNMTAFQKTWEDFVLKLVF